MSPGLAKWILKEFCLTIDLGYGLCQPVYLLKKLKNVNMYACNSFDYFYITFYMCILLIIFLLFFILKELIIKN